MNTVFMLIYFYLPGALANMGANLGKHVPWFKSMTVPVDYHLSLNGIRLIGDHKQLGSFLFGVILGTFFGIIKTLVIDPYVPQALLIHQSAWENISMYTLISFGALMGDLIESAIKRQIKKNPHSPWIPFDEIDHSLTSLLLAKIFFPIAWADILKIIVIFFFLHLITNVTAYKLNLKKVPY